MVGRCELADEIAFGGMATIHLGRMRGAGGFGRIVAVKRMHAQFSRSPDFVAMFLDEARIVARVSHTNVVPTLDLVEEGGDLFIIMEYVEGLSLAALMRAAREKGERAPPTVVTRILTETLHGLHAAHEATDEDGEPMNIVHRDVSPENVLVGVDGHPRMLDFGVARASSRLGETRDGQIKGKIAYMAPEQVMGLAVDRRTDVYAASAILWQALTGRRLWKAQNIVQLTHKLLHDRIAPPTEVAPDCPPELDAIVMRGLERDPASRWRTALDMADALESAGRPATHREVGLWVRRLGSGRLAELAAKVAAVETRDRDKRVATSGRERKPSLSDAGRAELKMAALLAEAEREGPRGPPAPEAGGHAVGVVTPTDDALWGRSDEFFAPRSPAAGLGAAPELAAVRDAALGRTSSPEIPPPAARGALPSGASGPVVAAPPSRPGIPRPRGSSPGLAAPAPPAAASAAAAPADAPAAAVVAPVAATGSSQDGALHAPRPGVDATAVTVVAGPRRAAAVSEAELAPSPPEVVPSPSGPISEPPAPPRRPPWRAVGIAGALGLVAVVVIVVAASGSGADADTPAASTRAPASASSAPAPPAAPLATGSAPTGGPSAVAASASASAARSASASAGASTVSTGQAGAPPPRTPSKATAHPSSLYGQD
ncbi:MAG: serine/threonine protein kinase [Myxococcales bacterium]|nr:serine/threonine protein kinase [Myxococcales bacterium]